MADAAPDAPRVSKVMSKSSRASDLVDAAMRDEEEKPIRCAKFRQQELWAWKPVWSPKVVVIMYLIVSVIFIPIGVVVFIQSDQLVSTTRLRYDQFEGCSIGNESTTDTAGTCIRQVNIDRDVEAPAYFYYGMVNFYQNARTYVTSRSDAQLRGDENPDTSNCEPLEFAPDGTTVLNPCGLVANSQFNDTFELCRDPQCTDKVDLNGTDISWEVDRTTRFLPDPTRSEEEDERVTSEDFMVWMRLAAFRNWKKLYRRITEDLPQGTYYVNITSRFPVEGFDGEKFFFISETTWFGGPNEVLGIAYMAVGGVALVLALTILIRSRTTVDLDLPPETTVLLDGIVADSELPKPAGALAQQPA